MSDAPFQIDNASTFLTKALNDFLRDKKLKLTPQQYKRFKKLLMVSQLDQDMSYSAAYNYLSNLMEYRKDYEIDANAPDEAEEEMIHLIGAADAQEVEVIVETTKFKKRFVIAASLLSLLCTGYISTKAYQYVKSETVKMASVISKQDEEAIKTRVQKLVELESAQGNDITVNAVYNDIKKLESVQKAGDATSYKKFNYAQLEAATEYLNNKISEKISTTQPAAGE